MIVNCTCVGFAKHFCKLHHVTSAYKPILALVLYCNFYNWLDYNDSTCQRYLLVKRINSHNLMIIPGVKSSLIWPPTVRVGGEEPCMRAACHWGTCETSPTPPYTNPTMHYFTVIIMYTAASMCHVRETPTRRGFPERRVTSLWWRHAVG